MNLGDLIKRLEACDLEADLRYDFCDLIPTTKVQSYRGFYEQLAIGFVDPRVDYESGKGEYKSIKVGDLLPKLKEAIGKTFTGYKGGEFEMNQYTPVWVANYGHCHGTKIVGVINHSYVVIIETRYEN